MKSLENEAALEGLRSSGKQVVGVGESKSKDWIGRQGLGTGKPQISPVV